MNVIHMYHYQLNISTEVTSPENKQVEVGDSLTFSCSFTTFAGPESPYKDLNIKWHKGNQPIPGKDLFISTYRCIYAFQYSIILQPLLFNYLMHS